MSKSGNKNAYASVFFLDLVFKLLFILVYTFACVVDGCKSWHSCNEGGMGTSVLGS